MPNQTNKDILNQIVKTQSDNATYFSDFVSKQEVINERLLGYLENNDKTNQVGVVQKQKELDTRVSKLETSKKVIVGVSVFLVGVSAWISGLLK